MTLEEAFKELAEAERLAPQTPQTPQTPQRLSITLDGVNYDYLKLISGLNRTSMKEYINLLIEQDRKTHKYIWEQSEKVRKELNK